MSRPHGIPRLENHFLHIVFNPTTRILIITSRTSTFATTTFATTTTTSTTITTTTTATTATTTMTTTTITTGPHTTTTGAHYYLFRPLSRVVIPAMDWQSVFEVSTLRASEPNRDSFNQLTSSSEPLSLQASEPSSDPGNGFAK